MKLDRKFAEIANVLRCKFTLDNQPIATERVFNAESGLLPAFLRRADQLCSFCLGYGLGVSFEPSSNGILSDKVIFDEVTPNSIRLLCVTDVLIELIQNSPSREFIPLDDLKMEYDQIFG